MTLEEAIQAYTERWGGYPAFLMMGMSDEEAAKKLQEAVESDEEIKPEEGKIY
jgi:hypothetical protein